MGRIEKTVFISYRRTNYWTALAIFQNLNANGYDVFFDYKSIPSGDFEQAIIENIKSRAHFILVLSQSALERCNEPGDWLRREMETAIDNQRNIIPLIMEGFDFGSPSTLKALTGKLNAFKKYNGLGIPAEYFDEAMAKLRSERFLNKPLELVSHPVADITRQITGELKSTANETAQVEAYQLTAEELFERAYAQQEAKNYEEAIRYYKEAIQLEPDLDAAHNNLGLLLRDLKRNDEAKAAYRKAIELNPDDDTAYSNLGILLCDLKRNDEAEAAFCKAIELNPADDKAYSNLGVLLRDLKRNDEAEAAYRKAIELNPALTEAYSNLGVFLRDLKRNDEAEAAYRKAIELNPAYDTAYSNLGILLCDLKRNDEAEAAYRKAIELNPAYDKAYFNLGNLLNDLKRNDEAEAAYRKAIELNPAYDKAYSNLGVILQDLKRNNEAEAAYCKAIELNPAYADAYSNLGNLLSDLKRNDEAEAAYRKAIELNPAYDTAYNNLILLLRLMNRTEEAMPLLEKWIEIASEDFNPYLALSSIGKQLGKTISSEHIAKARQFLSEDDWYNRACLESVCDNFDLAFEYLEKAAQLERFNPSWAWDDPDLQWLRADPRFAKIVGSKQK